MDTAYQPEYRTDDQPEYQTDTQTDTQTGNEPGYRTDAERWDAVVAREPMPTARSSTPLPRPAYFVALVRVAPAAPRERRVLARPMRPVLPASGPANAAVPSGCRGTWPSSNGLAPHSTPSPKPASRSRS